MSPKPLLIVLVLLKNAAVTHFIHWWVPTTYNDLCHLEGTRYLLNEWKSLFTYLISSHWSRIDEFSFLSLTWWSRPLVAVFFLVCGRFQWFVCTYAHVLSLASLFFRVLLFFFSHAAWPGNLSWFHILCLFSLLSSLLPPFLPSSPSSFPLLPFFLHFFFFSSFLLTSSPIPFALSTVM